MGKYGCYFQNNKKYYFRNVFIEKINIKKPVMWVYYYSLTLIFKIKKYIIEKRLNVTSISNDGKLLFVGVKNLIYVFQMEQGILYKNEPITTLKAGNENVFFFNRYKY